MRPSFLSVVAAAALVTGCSSSPSTALPVDGGAPLDATSPGADASPSADASGPAFGWDASDAEVDAGVCPPLPGCASLTSCPSGDGCDTCVCYAGVWDCPVHDCAEAGVEAGADGGGFCPGELLDGGTPCTDTPVDLVCVYGNHCPIFFGECVDGGWETYGSPGNICPP